MSTLKIAGKLPKYDDRNGVTADIVRQFLGDPGTPQLAVVVLQTTKITDDLENYDKIPTVGIRAIEVIGGDELGRLRAMLQRRHAERTGNLELPAEWESVLASMAAPKLPGTDR